VSIKCEVTLSSKPPDPTLVNVYFDRRVVKLDPKDGWTWGSIDGGAAIDARAESAADGAADAGSPVRIEIVGEACAELKRGDVSELQVVAGCPSVVK
jgi:hypothetical protein